MSVLNHRPKPGRFSSVAVRRGRPVGITLRRQLQRLVIAEAILNGAHNTAIAQRLGVSRSWASREANAPETRAFLSCLVERNSAKIAQMLANALETLNRAYDATMVVRVSQVDIEIPDHRIRLEAAGLFIRLVTILGTRQSKVADRPAEVEKTRDVPTESSSRPTRRDYRAQFSAVRLLIRILSKL
mgnify:CR=1 FL=1